MRKNRMYFVNVVIDGVAQVLCVTGEGLAVANGRFEKYLSGKSHGQIAFRYSIPTEQQVLDVINLSEPAEVL